MNYIFLILTFFSIITNAQVNLDRSFNGKSGNRLFHDLNDPNVVWAIPKYLEATSADDIIKVGSEIRVKFFVGLPQSTLLDLKPETNSSLMFRAFRATTATLEQFTDIDPKLKPRVDVLGDIGMFGEAIPYSLSLDIKKYPNTAKHTARHVFDGKSMIALGKVFYYFSASVANQPYQAQSTVSILTPRKLDKKVNMYSTPINEFTIQDDVYDPQIQYNSQTACWDKALPNVICLKD